ncbi:MAG: GNAT family N-acetyltransferase [Gammaproteobacteria bacterium]
MQQRPSISPKISLREAKVADFAILVALSSQLLKYDKAFDKSIDLNWFGTKSGSDFLRERLEGKNGIVFLAEDAKNPIGYVVAGLVEAESYRNIKVVAELEEIFVLEEYRRVGVGKKLVDQFFSWAKEKKADKISVVVSAANLRTIDFYRRMGFLDYDLVLERNLG